MTPEMIARLRISLDDSEPEIRGMADVPRTGIRELLRDMIQAAMGREDDHPCQCDAGAAATAYPPRLTPDTPLCRRRARLPTRAS